MRVLSLAEAPNGIHNSLRPDPVSGILAPSKPNGFIAPNGVGNGPALPRSKIPSVTIDADTITDSMAARLALSVIGHVMFLKSQVPFPLVQMMRMPSDDDTSRAARKRLELLAAYDTLSSHLATTFTALSTALALRRHAPSSTSAPHSTSASSAPIGTTFPNTLSPHSQNTPPDAPERQDNSQNGTIAQADTLTTSNSEAPKEIAGDRDDGTAYLAIVLGPTAGAPRARVIVGFNGLQVRVWGARSEAASRAPNGPSKESVFTKGSGGGAERDRKEEGLGSAEGVCNAPSPRSANESANGDDEEAYDFPEDSGSSSSESTSDTSESDSDSILSSDDEDEDEQELSYAQEQEALRAADRLLSRTLAAANAEDDAGGLVSELAPTQTHILLRAPRRFAHPAWTPRPALAKTMDAQIEAFVAQSRPASASSSASSPNGKGSAKAAKGPLKAKEKVEGVWICSRSAGDVTGGAGGEIEGKGGEREEDEDEDDELIWWTWDGKMVGFAEW